MTKPFNGVIIVDIRDSVPDRAPYETPFPFTGGRINNVTINVSGEPCTYLEKEARALSSRQ